MPATPTDDVTLMRQPYHRFTNETLCVFDLQVTGNAETDTPPAEFPFADIPVVSADAGFMAARRGQMFRVYDGTTIVLEGVHRKNQAGEDELLFGLGLSQGDQGRSFNEQLTSLAAGLTVETYSVRPPYSFFTRLDDETSTIYKRWDLPYTDEGENPSAQGNLGSHQVIFAVAGVGTTTFSAANSFSWVGGTLTYEWELPTGVTLTGGSLDTDEEIEIEAEPGNYVIGCQIADSVSGTNERSYRYLWCLDPDDNPAFSDMYDIIAITKDEENQRGRVMSFTVQGENVADLIYTGAPVCFVWTDEFSEDGVTWETPTEGAITQQFFGYIRSYDQATFNGDGIQTITFTAMTPLLWAEHIRFIPQPMFEADTPDDWQYVIPDLAHMGFYAQYVRDFHCRWWAECHDYYPGDAVDYFRAVFSLDGETMAAAIQNCAAQMTGNAGDTSDGTLYLKRNPNLEDVPPDTTFRDALANVWTWTDADIVTPDDPSQPAITFNRDMVLKYSETETGFFIYGASGTTEAIHVRAGKGAPMQGLSTQRTPASVEMSEARGKAKGGHIHAFSNRSVGSVSVSVLGHRDGVLNPALMEWHTLDIGDYACMCQGVFDNRVLVESVSRTWDLEQGFRTAVANFIPYSSGLPARLKLIPVYGGSGITPPRPDSGGCDATLTNDFNGTGNNHGWSLLAGAASSWDCGAVSFGARILGGSRVASGWQVNSTDAVGISRTLDDGVSGTYTICNVAVTASNSTGSTNTRLTVLWGKIGGVWTSLKCQRIPFPTSGSPSLTWTGSATVTELAVVCAVGGGTITIEGVVIN